MYYYLIFYLNYFFDFKLIGFKIIFPKLLVIGTDEKSFKGEFIYYLLL